MGNVFTKKLTSRQKACKILNLLPNWFFEPTSRVIINPAVLRIREELENYCEPEWDSALDYSIDSLEMNFYENDNDELACDWDAIYLPNEIRLLREEIANLIYCNHEDTFSTSTPVKTINENNIKPPPPPPSLENIVNNPRKNQINVENSFLNEIKNVKLKPANNIHEPKKDNDVRNDLHEILKRRFSVMHSPNQSVVYGINDTTTSESQETYFNFTLHPQESIATC